MVAKEKGNRDEQVSPKVNCGLGDDACGVGRFMHLFAPGKGLQCTILEGMLRMREAVPVWEQEAYENSLYFLLRT